MVAKIEKENIVIDIESVGKKKNTRFCIDYLPLALHLPFGAVHCSVHNLPLP